MAAFEDIHNFRRVHSRLATAGQPTEPQLRSLAEAGVEVVINLAPPGDKRSLANEALLLQSLGVEYISIPVDFAAPGREEFLAFCEAMDQHGERSVFIHCLANHRVTAFLGLYEILRRGRAPEEAFALMHSLWQPNATWTAFIDAQLAMR